MLRHCFLSLLLVASPYCLSSPADLPEPRQQNYEWMSLESWYQFHEEDKRIAEQGEARLLFQGDSITQGWNWDLWQSHFAAYDPANFGIGGDKTENVLWRLQNGGIGKLKPEMIVLMIGVNNFGHDNDSAEEVAKGVGAILTEIRKHWPESKVLLLGILPYGEKQERANRQRVIQANTLLAQLAEEFNYSFADFGSAFIEADGNIPRALMQDLLHPTADGYQILADKLLPFIQKNMQVNHIVNFNDGDITIEGRYHLKMDNSVDVGFPGVSFHFNFVGKKLALLASSSSGKNLLDIYVNGKFQSSLELQSTPASYTLFESNKEKKLRVELVHRSESWHGTLNMQGLNIFDGRLLSHPELPQRKIVILGDSITCGEAVHRKEHCQKDFSWWDPEHSYGKLLGDKLKAQVHLVCHGGRGLVRSWNGKTDEANVGDFLHYALSVGKDSPVWEHQNFQADLVLVNIGTNDYSSQAGPFPHSEQYEQAWITLFKDIHSVYPNAKIAATGGPMLTGEARAALASSLDGAIAAYTKDHSQSVKHIPLQVRAGDDCDAHPDGQAHRAMSKELSPALRDWMNW